MKRHEVPLHRAGRANGFFLGFLAIAGYFLLTEHRAHVVPYLPFLLLLACPLMYLFMHGGHEQGNRDERNATGAHGGCCGHRHSSEHNGQAHGHEHGAVNDETKRSDRPV